MTGAESAIQHVREFASERPVRDAGPSKSQQASSLSTHQIVQSGTSLVTLREEIAIGLHENCTVSAQPRTALV